MSIFKYKVAVVTGSSRSIGRGIALVFAREGCAVVVNYSKSREEAQVRETLDGFWEKPDDATGALGALRRGNKDLYRFEERLEAIDT